jgi:hypothetical protein
MELGRESLFVGVRILSAVLCAVYLLIVYREYESILPLFLLGEKPTSSVLTSRTRRDFAQELYNNCLRCD